MTQFTNYLINVLGNNKAAKDSLRNLQFFNHASNRLLDIIYHYGRVSKLNPGDTLIKEGDFDQWIYLILEGSISIYVGDKYIDKGGSSLVGERCILGEQRKATLKADELVYAFGVDMAITDALYGTNAKADLHEAYNEFLLLIVEHVLSRIINLWLSATIYHDNGDEILISNGRQQFMDALAFEDFSEKPEIMAYLWLQLKKIDKKLPAKFWNCEHDYLNSRQLMFKQFEVHNIIVDKIIDELLAWDSKYQILKLNSVNPPETINFSEISDPFKEPLQNHLAGLSVLDQIKLDFNKIFSFGNHGETGLGYLDKLLTINKVPFEKVTKLWLSFIEKALTLNQKLNEHMANLNSYYGPSILTSHPMYAISDIKSSAQKELANKNFELIKNNLIMPYITEIDKMKQSDTQPPAQAPDASVTTTDKPAKAADTFDTLIEQLGATPGVPIN